jgi:hypothetical protein
MLCWIYKISRSWSGRIYVEGGCDSGRGLLRSFEEVGEENHGRLQRLSSEKFSPGVPGRCRWVGLIEFHTAVSLFVKWSGT